MSINDSPIITLSPASNKPPIRGIKPRIAEPIIDTRIISIISPRSARRTLKEREIEYDIPDSSMTITTNMNNATGISIIVIDINAPTIDAKKKVKKRPRT